MQNNLSYAFFLGHVNKKNPKIIVRYADLGITDNGSKLPLKSINWKFIPMLQNSKHVGFIPARF